MTSQISHSVNRSGLVFYCACIAVAISLIVISGWLLDIPLLRSVLPGFPEMKPNTALAFGLIGGGLFCLPRAEQSEWRSSGATVCGLFVYLIGALTLGEHITGSNFGIDTFILPASGMNDGELQPGRMSPHSAFNLTVAGLSLLLLSGRAFLKRTSEVLALLVSVGTFAAVLGHLYGAEKLYGLTKYSSMALPSIGLFFICSFALLAANPVSRSVRLLTSRTLGGTAARRLLPAVVLVPTIVGWLRLWGERQGFYDSGFGVALSIFSCVALMFCLVLFFAGAIHRSDHERQQVELALAEKEERFRELFDYSQGMICIHDLSGVLMTVNPATLRSLGYSADELIGRNLVELLPADQREGIGAFFRKIENEGLSDGLLPIEAKDGTRLVWRYHSILVSEPGKEPYIIGHAQDVTELIEAQKQLKSLSVQDELTGLYNRRGFLTMAEQQIKLERHEGTARGLTLMFADMDGLKKINDVYGHEAGSDAIIELSKIIDSSLRSSDLVARWGGDEFVILTIGSQDEHADRMSERIYSRLAEYNKTSGRPYELACSIGVAPIVIGDNRTFESMLDEADRAMYAEKRRRKMTREHLSGENSPLPPHANNIPGLESTDQRPPA